MTWIQTARKIRIRIQSQKKYGSEAERKKHLIVEKKVKENLDGTFLAVEMDPEQVLYLIRAHEKTGSASDFFEN